MDDGLSNAINQIFISFFIALVMGAIGIAVLTRFRGAMQMRAKKIRRKMRRANAIAALTKVAN